MNQDMKKRMISDTGYEVKQAFRINGKEILLAENPRADDGQFYLVCDYTEKGIIAEYAQAQVSDSYVEIVQVFSDRIAKEAMTIQVELDSLGLPSERITADECHPHSYDQSIVGQVVAIKESVLSPEYRRGDVQLVFVTGGNGSQANARGSAVFCYHLNNGEDTRFERRDVLGVVKELPDWAKARLAAIQADRAAVQNRKAHTPKGRDNAR